jgi:hypothetical protein
MSLLKRLSASAFYYAIYWAINHKNLLRGSCRYFDGDFLERQQIAMFKVHFPVYFLLIYSNCLNKISKSKSLIN